MAAAAPTVVVGGGLAGLAVAVELAGHGRRVVLLEAAPLLGGRARSWRDDATGDVIDNGQHVFMGCYEATLALLGRVGAVGRLRFQERLDVAFFDAASGRTARLRCPPLPAPLHLLGGLLRLATLGARERAAAVRVAAALRAPGRLGAAARDDQPADAWLESLGQSPRARRAFWAPLCVAALNEEPARASALLLAAVLREAFLGGRAASRIGLPTCGLSDLYAEPARAYVAARGGVVRTGAPVERLLLDGARAVGVALRDGTQLEAADVVLAVPPRAALRLVPEEAHAAAGLAGAARLETSPIVSIHLWLDRPIEAPAPFLALLDSPIHWIFDRARLAGTRAPGRGALSLVVSGARALVERPGDELIELGLHEARRALPSLRAAALVHGRVIKEREATIAPTAGAYALRPPNATGIAHLLLAADWTATGLPATLEGAARSARSAAGLLVSPRA